MKEDTKVKILTYLMVTVVVVGVMGLAMIQPFMEARTYNKFTDGPKATVVDAMFGKLRITGN